MTAKDQNFQFNPLDMSALISLLLNPMKTVLNQVFLTVFRTPYTLHRHFESSFCILFSPRSFSCSYNIILNFLLQSLSSSFSFSCFCSFSLSPVSPSHFPVSPPPNDPHAHSSPLSSSAPPPYNTSYTTPSHSPPSPSSFAPTPAAPHLLLFLFSQFLLLFILVLRPLLILLLWLLNILLLIFLVFLLFCFSFSA